MVGWDDAFLVGTALSTLELATTGCEADLHSIAYDLKWHCQYLSFGLHALALSVIGLGKGSVW